MNILKFDSRFVFPILEDEKNSTIRRDTELQVGETVELTALLAQAGAIQYAPIKKVNIQSIKQIEINSQSKRVKLMGRELGLEDIQTLFYQNGWDDIHIAFDYYEKNYGQEFMGVMITWE